MNMIRRNTVPVLFVCLSVAGLVASGENPLFLIQETVSRLARNWFLVLSLIIPVTAGLGLNFGIVLGGMAGQIGLIMATHWRIPGIAGLLTALVLAVPVAVLLGASAGVVLNRARGREMITSMILGFFANGIYQLVFLFMVGTVIPFKNTELLLPGGVGLRNTVEVKYAKCALDNLLLVTLWGVPVPIVTFMAVAALCLAIRLLYRTKLGQDMRAVGLDAHVATVAGINVDQTRVVAMVLSTVLAAIGQIIFLQNIGTINTYNSHEQIGTFAIASLLVGGATVVRATVGQALLGTFLFQILFIVSPGAGQRLMGSPQVGEYFRVFVAYGIIAIALVLHAWERSDLATHGRGAKGTAQTAG